MFPLLFENLKTVTKTKNLMWLYFELLNKPLSKPVALRKKKITAKKKKKKVTANICTSSSGVYPPGLAQLLKLETTKEDSTCGYLITFIHKYKEEIKSGHDRSWQIYILFQWLWSVIVSTDRVCCCQNGRPGIQSSLTTKGKIVIGLKIIGMANKHTTKCSTSLITN